MPYSGLRAIRKACRPICLRSIALADDGFVRHSTLSRRSNIHRRFSAVPVSEHQWFPNGKPLPWHTHPAAELAGTLRLIARRTGSILSGTDRKGIVAYLKQEADSRRGRFASYSARIGPALHSSYRGYELYESPNGRSITLDWRH